MPRRCGSVVAGDPSADGSVSLRGVKADELESAEALGLALPEICPASAASRIAYSSPVANVLDCVGQDPVGADLERVFASLDQPMPARPDCSQNVGDSLVFACRAE